MSKIKRKKKKVFISLLVLLGLVALVMFSIYSNVFQIIRGKLYSGNRIELDLSIYYNGNLITSDMINVTCTNPEGQKEKVVENVSKYSVKGGKYGKYYFYVTIKKDIDNNIENNEEVSKINNPKEIIEETITLELQFLNSNDWYISKSDCIVEIDSIGGKLNCNCKVSTEYNDGTSSDYYEEKIIEDDIIRFSWGG